jgi:hypothetical protein
MTELTPEARAIIDAGRDGDMPSELARARIRRALFAHVATAGVTLAASGATALGLGKVLMLATVLAMALAVAGGVGGTLAGSGHGQAVSAPTWADPIVTAARLPPVPMPVVPHSPPRNPRRPRLSADAREVVSIAPVPANRLAEETALLAGANARLREGDAPLALALLADYELRYPSGVLREEVLATRIIARCQLRPDADVSARRAAAAFLTRHAASPLAARVRSTCTRPNAPPE